MACITCGSQFDSSFKAIVERKKKIYENTKEVYIVYKKDNVWNVTKAKYFDFKNFKDEYFHISEFK